MFIYFTLTNSVKHHVLTSVWNNRQYVGGSTSFWLFLNTNLKFGNVQVACNNQTIFDGCKTRLYGT